MTDAVVCASCPETYHDRVAELCLQHQVQKAFRKAGDTLNKRRGKGWIPKWEAKVVMATVTMAQTLNTNKAQETKIVEQRWPGNLHVLGQS